jgi:hypothetical protein
MRTNPLGAPAPPDRNSHKANERGEHTARLVAINRFECVARVFAEVLIHKQAWDLSPGRPISTNITSMDSDS